MHCNLCKGEVFQKLPFYYEWEGKRFQGVRCRRCKLVTLDPLPTDDELEKLYSEEYFETGLHGLDQLGTCYENHADASIEAARMFIRNSILKRKPNAKTIFEIGAAMGHFLVAARAEGLNGTGVEISSAAVMRAQEKFNLEIQQGNIEKFDTAPWESQWDVVYAGDLFEHLRNPVGVLSKVKHLLEPGGLCIVRVPSTLNLLSSKLAIPLLSLLGRNKKLPDKPYHLYEYTTSTARMMFSHHFSRVEVENEATLPSKINLKDRSIGYIAKYLVQFLNYPLTRLTHRFGDRMTIYSWK